jgi:hypothetical protein
MAQAAPTSAAPPLRVCPGCGVIAPTQTTSCTMCGTAFGACAPVVAGGFGNAVWACILECDVPCRACGLRTPVSGFHLAGEIFCERCGQFQRFLPDQWRGALGHAHEVARFCGPRAMGLVSPRPEQDWLDVRLSMFAAIGVTESVAEHTGIAQPWPQPDYPMRVRVSPGHPLCVKCHEPLGVGLDGSGRMQTTCARCGERAIYALPPGARDLYRPVLGVISSEHRTDRAQAKIDRAAGLVALRCPSCGAPISVSGPLDVVTCNHCQASSSVPRQAFARPGIAPVFTPIWVLLDGQYDRIERLAPEQVQFELNVLERVQEKRAQPQLAKRVIVIALVGVIISSIILFVIMGLIERFFVR